MNTAIGSYKLVVVAYQICMTILILLHCTCFLHLIRLFSLIHLEVYKAIVTHKMYTTKNVYKLYNDALSMTSQVS